MLPDIAQARDKIRRKLVLKLELPVLNHSRAPV